MNNKKFVLTVCLIVVVLIISLSQFINQATVNHVLYKLSQKHIKQSNKKNEIVFIGDSSLGTGINSAYFSKLSKMKVSSLPLSAGGHNLGATYNMIRHVVNNNNELKALVIMQAPSIWNEDFNLPGFCSTLNDLDSIEAKKLKLIGSYDCFKFHYFNIRAIYDAYRQNKAESKRQENRKQRKEKKISNETQNNEKENNLITTVKTYKNNGVDIKLELKLNIHNRLNIIAKSKESEINMIDRYLENKNVKVLYLQGTLHNQLALKYSNSIKRQHAILKKLKNIIFIEKFLYPKNENMGDAENHVDTSYKSKSTEFYYDAIKEFF